MELYKLGVKARKKSAEKTDEILLNFIQEKPGLPLYQIADEMEWSIGKVQKSLNRLRTKELIKFKRIIAAGRVLKLAIPVGLAEAVPSIALRSSRGKFIEIPFDMISSEHWRESARVYGLDRITMGIATGYVKEWEEKSTFKEETPIKFVEQSLIIQVPTNISRFYLLENSKYAISSVPEGNKIIVTVEKLVTEGSD